MNEDRETEVGDAPFDGIVARLARRLAAFDRGALSPFGGRKFERDMTVEQGLLRMHMSGSMGVEGAALSQSGTSDILLEDEWVGSCDEGAKVRFRKVILKSGDSGVAEIITTPTGGRSVRVLNLSWNDHTTNFVTDVYGLSKAETHVCREFIASCDLQAVAAARGTSEGTVRQQLKSIFAKTGARNQAQLVRSLAIACARTRSSAQQRPWADPFGRERLFLDPEGRQIAFTQLGAQDGRPAILVHGPLTGYVIPEEVEEGLHRADITLWAVSRPGFGNSEPDPDRPAIDAGAQCIEALMDHLGITACAGIGIICGLAPLVRLAAQQPERITALIGIGASAPLDKVQHRHRLPALQRVVINLATLSPKALEVVFLHAVRAVAENDLSFIIRRMYGQCPSDIACIADDALLARLVEGSRMIMARDPKVFLKDLQMMSYPWSDDLKRANVRCHMLCGVEDPIFPPAVIEPMGREIGANVEILPSAGQLVSFQHPQRVLEAIRYAVD